MYDFHIGLDRRSAARGPARLSLSYEDHEIIRSCLAKSGLFIRFSDYYKDCQFHMEDFDEVKSQLSKLTREVSEIGVFTDFAENFQTMIDEARASSSHVFGIAD